MKKKLLIGLAIILILCGGMLLKMKLTKYEPVSVNLDLTELKNGRYLGSHKEPAVNVEVAVTIKDNKIKNIEILKHDCGLGKKAESLTEEIIKYQTLEVDSVSGATVSSNTIKLAIKEALKQ